MADANTFKLDQPASPAVWDKATDEQKKGYWRRLGELAIERKRWELNRGLDVSGEKMQPVQQPRPDGAEGPPLSPHVAGSRSQKWLRATAGRAHVTVWWSHGWGKILGYHAEGVVIGAYKRDVIGLTPAGEKSVYKKAEDWLRNKIRLEAPKPEPPKPKPEPKATRTPMRRVQVGTVKRKPIPIITPVIGRKARNQTTA